MTKVILQLKQKTHLQKLNLHLIYFVINISSNTDLTLLFLIIFQQKHDLPKHNSKTNFTLALHQSTQNSSCLKTL